MSPTQTIDEAKQKMQAAADRFHGELTKLRTGRANAAMLDGVMVEVYGTQMPLIQVATIVVPEPQLLQLTPFDPNNLQAIVMAIRNNQGLGLNPTDDGHVVRVPIPPLTEERRKDLAKQAASKLEECLVSMRGARHEAQGTVTRLKKDKVISEDEGRRIEKQIDEAMAAIKLDAESVAKSKEAEILAL